MSETTLQRAYDRLREQLAEDPPVMLKLLDDDMVLGVLVGVETREDDKGNEFEVAILGDVDVAGVSDPPEDLDEDQLVSVSISGVNIKRQWDKLEPKPGEPIGIRRIRSVRTRQGRDANIFNLCVDRPEGDGTGQ